MKKFFIFFMFLSLPLISKNNHDIFYHGLEFSLVSGFVTDTYTTYKCLDTGKCIETNPISKLYIHNKPLTFIITGISSYVIIALNRAMRKDCKWLSTVTMIVLNTIVWKTVIHNFKVLKEFK